MENIPPYDATYALTHLLRTLHASTKPGERFDATQALSTTLRQVAAGGAVPTTPPTAVFTPSVAPTLAQTFRVDKPKGKDK